MSLQHKKRRWFVLANITLLGLSACAFGESDDPGCHSDSECGNGRFCRAGACFRIIGDMGDLDASPSEDDAG